MSTPSAVASRCGVFRIRAATETRSQRILSRLAGLSVIVAVLVAPSICGADQADDDYQNAVAHYKKQRWKDAAEEFLKFQRKHKTDRRIPFARLYRGIALENLEKYKEARTVLRGFVKDYPKNKSRNDALFRVAECSYFLNDLKAAETEFLTFLKADPKHEFGEFALPYLGDVQYRLKKPKQAAAHFELALKRFENGRMADDARFGLARCRMALNQPDEAIKLFRELSKKTESTLAADAQLELGSLLFSLKRFDAAGKAFDEFDTHFAKHPQRFRARMNAGFAHFRGGDYRKAVKRFASAAESDALKPEAAYWSGIAYKSLNEYDKAVAVLKAEFQRSDKSPAAADILFQWADCERLQANHAAAGSLYLDYVKRWPKNADADDALHFAGEMALLQGQTEVAQKLVDRFRKEYPQSDIWPYRDLLQAKIYAAGTDKQNYRKAAALLENVAKTSRIIRTQHLARYHLARTYRLLGEHGKALQTVGPLVKDVQTKGADSEFVHALILAGRSHLAEKQFDKAVETTTLYLKLGQDDTQTIWALSTRAAAAFETGDKKLLHSDVDRLIKEFPKNPATGQTVHHLAETAYQKKDWKSAGALFSALTRLGKESRFHAAALSGLGWSQFEQKEYAKASATFGQLLKQHPDEESLAPQAAYKQAECAEKLENQDEAAKKYLAAFQRFAPKSPAKAGSEKKGGPHYYTYHAGLNAARLLAKQKDVKAADAAYEQLLTKFPQPEHLDLRLDEWALLNYNAKNYKRADEIFRRLLKETPKSPLVDNARYTLAESDLNSGNLNAAKKVFAELYGSKKSDATVKEVSLYRLIGIATEQEDWKAAQTRAAEFQKTFPNSRHRWYAAFSEAEARFHRNDLDGAKKILQTLKAEKADSVAGKSVWFSRVWLIAAEIANRQSRYDEVAETVTDAKTRFAKWPRVYLFDEILARSLIRQAKFKEAREAFRRVVMHPEGRRTETAAKCQFLLAESYLKQNDDYAAARKEYLKVDNLYAYPQWQAPALYMAGQCEEKLKDYSAAAKTYTDLIRRFPKSTYATKAKPRLKAVKEKAGDE